MKTLNKILLTLASILALISCEKDGEKIYLQSLGSDELIATTDKVVLSVETSQKVVLSFAWKGQDVHINDTTVGTAAKAKNYMEISLSEDFSGQIYKDETTSNSIAYKGGELNSIVNGLGAKVGEVNNVFFRLGSATGENIPYAYSNVVKVDVTPYVMDMRIGKIIQSSSNNTDLTDTGYFLYSPEDNGIYSGFMFTEWNWYNYFLKEADETTWGTDNNVAFTINSNTGKNMWFPEHKGCYYVNVNTVEKRWDALSILTLKVEGLGEQIDLILDNESKMWIANFKAAETGDKTITISGSGKQYNAETGPDEAKSIDTEIHLATDENNNLILAENPGTITVNIPTTGNYNIKLDLIDPLNRKVYVAAGTTEEPSEPSIYPEKLQMQRWPFPDYNMVIMKELDIFDSENGIYKGTYEGSYQKISDYGFQFVDVDNNKWYKPVTEDNTKLEINDSNDGKFYFDKADDNVIKIEVEITVDLNNHTWEYNIISQKFDDSNEPGDGGDTEVTYPETVSMVYYPNNIEETFGEELKQTDIPGVYETIYTGKTDFNFVFKDSNNNYYKYNYIKGEGNDPFALVEDGSDDLYFEGGWSETEATYKITVDLANMRWSFTKQN